MGADKTDEIDKIMSEIENLQREMNEAVEVVIDESSVQEATPEAEVTGSDVMAEFHAGGNEVGIEETLGQLEEEPAAGPTLLDEPIASVTPLRVVSENVSKGESMSVQNEENATVESGCLSMTLTGNMTLKLKYEYEGEEVHIGFSDHALKVQLSDGTEFKIPVNRKNVLKQAA